MDFPHNNSFDYPYPFLLMKPYMVGGVGLLFGLFEVGEPSLLGTDLIYKSLEKDHIIKNHLQTTYSRQKSYVDHRGRDLDFEQGYKMNLKILPMKGMVRF